MTQQQLNQRSVSTHLFRPVAVDGKRTKSQCKFLNSKCKTFCRSILMKNTCRCHKHVTFYWECCIIKSTLSLYQGGNCYKVPSHVNRTVDTDLIMQISKYCYLLSVLQGQNYYITTVILTLEALFSLYGHSTMERVIVVQYMIWSRISSKSGLYHHHKFTC